MKALGIHVGLGVLLGLAAAAYLHFGPDLVILDEDQITYRMRREASQP